MMYIAKIGVNKVLRGAEKTLPLFGRFLRERYLIRFPAIAPLFQRMLNLNAKSQLRIQWQKATYHSKNKNYNRHRNSFLLDYLCCCGNICIWSWRSGEPLALNDFYNERGTKWFLSVISTILHMRTFSMLAWRNPCPYLDINMSEHELGVHQ